MSQSMSHARYPGARTAPSKWKVRKLMPIRSWHSVAAVASELCIVFINGNISSSIRRPSSACAMRGSESWVAVSGGGVGACDSHIRRARDCGSGGTHLRIGGHQLAQRVGPGAGEPDDEDGSAHHLVIDLGVLCVGVFDLESLDQRVADGGVLNDVAHLRQLGLVV